MSFLKYLKKLFYALLIFGTLVAIGGGVAAYLFYDSEIEPLVPDVSTVKTIGLKLPMKIYTQDGKLINEVGTTRRYLLTYDQIPQSLRDALVVTEDSRFYEHSGVDFLGLVRAAIEWIRTGEKKQGASTLTMQLARNYYLSRKKTVTRKLVEIMIALKLEQMLSKDDILLLYMNKVFLGYRSYGFETAAQTYYGKKMAELTVAESAMLAGLPKAPSTFNPIINPSRAKVRRDYILQRMLSEGKISQAVYQEALATPVHAKRHGADIELEAGYVSEMARVEAREILGEDAFTGGYKVITTIDSKKQQAANEAVQNGLLAYNLRQPYPGAAKYFNLPEGQEWGEASFEDAIEAVEAIEGLHRAVVVESGNSAVKFMLEASDQQQQRHIELDQQQLKLFKTYDPQRPIIETPLYPDESTTSVEVMVEFTTVSIFIGQESTQIVTINDEGAVEVISTLVNVYEDIQRPVDFEAIKVELPTILPVGAVAYLQYDKKWLLNTAPIAQGALISLNPFDGSIQALVGGYSYQNYKFNRAIQATRQPGSNFKPFIYAAALSKGYTAASIINDAPLSFEDYATGNLWQPSNYSGRYFGPTRLREGLVKSRNLVSVRLMHQVGINYSLNYLTRFGFSARKYKLNKNLSVALGSVPTSALNIARGYAVFANGGYLITPHVISKILDSDGKVVYQNKLPVVCDFCAENTQGVAQKTLDSDVNYIMSNILKDVVQSGTGRRARTLNRKDLGGKTGTTNNQFDAWFSGFSQGTLTTVWVGKDSPATLGKRETGSRLALPIWIDYMKIAIADEIPKPVEPPENIVTVKINKKTGRVSDLLANDNNVMFEIFRRQYVPESEQTGTQPSGESTTQDNSEGNSESALREKLF